MHAISKNRALAYIHLAAILFGSTGIFGAVIQTSAIMITFGRAVFAVLSLAFFSYWRSQPVFPTLTLKALLNICKAGGLLAVHWITFFIAVKLGGVAIATLGFASFPAFITLIEHFIYKETASGKDWLALVLVSIGLVLITPTFSLQDSGTIALLWGLLSGLTFALLALSNRYATTNIAPLQVATMQNCVVALLTLPFIALELPTVSVTNWFWIALLGIVCTGLSHFLFVSSLTKLKARVAGLVIALEPLYAIIFAWILFHEVPTVTMIIGGLFILSAVLSSNLKSE